MKRLILGFTVAVFAAIPAQADWVPADGHKMHFPQLPDLDGWDVYAVGNHPSPAQQKMLADDWTCSGTGPVTDIHFWGSWQNGNTGDIQSFTVSIWTDMPVGPNGHSSPDQLVWDREVFTFPTVPIDPPTSQGWYNPNTGLAVHPDHQNFFQYNMFFDETEAFIQQEGQTYWLGISANLTDPINTAWGWKTADVDQYPLPFTGNHYRDDAVWVDPAISGFPPLPIAWNELTDPFTTQSLDLAFVITPEPGSAVLALLGASMLGMRRRRR